MQRTRHFGGLLVVLATLGLSAAGPAQAAPAASVSLTPSGVAPGAMALEASGAATRRSAPAAACAPGATACPIRITFGSGAYSGQAHAQLAGIHSARWFVVHARAGQSMVVIVEGRGPTRGVVHFPNGRSSGQPGGRVFDATVPVTGDYRIRVTESSMAEAWSGRVDVVVVIY